MDPNATLQEIREIVKRTNQFTLGVEFRTESELLANAHGLVKIVELIEALDNWIVDCRFLPEAWDDPTDPEDE